MAPKKTAAPPPDAPAPAVDPELIETDQAPEAAAPEPESDLGGWFRNDTLGELTVLDTPSAVIKPGEVVFRSRTPSHRGLVLVDEPPPAPEAAAPAGPAPAVDAGTGPPASAQASTDPATLPEE